MVTKIQIRNRYTGEIIYEYECENNSIRKTVEEAVRNGVALYGADLSYADLYGANLRGAKLIGADLNWAKLSEADLKGADLREANLSGAKLNWAKLSKADLKGADLRGANLRGANLRGAKLSEANLYAADIREADLREAKLIGADLNWAKLSEANLRGANLKGVNLEGAYLYGADLKGVENIPYIPLGCPSDGAFTGWKKVCGYIIELEIPADARRSSATTRKCRCSKAKVISIKSKYDGTGIEEIVNTNYAETTYRVGEMVYPDSFDEDRFNECSHGIHFFINKQDAIDY